MNMRGFTIMEIIVVLFIFGTLIMMPMPLFWGFGRSDQLAATTQEVVGVLNEAQTDTLSGKSVDSQQTSSYGVYFETNDYIFFSGATYNANDSNNQKTDLPPGLTFSQLSLPNSQVVFDKVTGEVLNYNASLNSIILKENNTGKVKTITIPKVGGITYQ